MPDSLTQNNAKSNNDNLASRGLQKYFLFWVHHQPQLLSPDFALGWIHLVDMPRVRTERLSSGKGSVAERTLVRPQPLVNILMIFVAKFLEKLEATRLADETFLALFFNA